MISQAGSRIVVACLSMLMASCASRVAGLDPEPAPNTNLPDPYRSERPWVELPGNRGWGSLSAVAIGSDGHSIWVADRCGPRPDKPPDIAAVAWDSCAVSGEASIHLFDSSGHLVRSFGAGLFVLPHKIYVDRAGNVWVADNRVPFERELKVNPAAANRGNAVYKFDPEGRLLLTIGTPGRKGNPPEALTEPNSIVEMPNGDIVIAEGHGGQAPNAPPDTVARISRFTADGRYVSSFGKLGSGPGEFRTPHDITIDSQGNLVVADRGNMRVQVLSPDGRMLREMKQWSRPSGVVLRGDTFYVADSESNGVYPHPGWLRGVRVGSYSTGVVRWRIPDIDELPGGTSAAEGIAVDVDGIVYGAEVGTRRLSRHVPVGP